MLRGFLEWLGAELASNSRSPLVLHKAEEYGQSRELTAKEVMACMTMSAMKGLTAGAGLGLIYIILCLLAEGLEWSFWGTVGIVVVVAIATTCIQAWMDLDEMRDGLRSYRSAETYSPPMPAGMPQLPAPDIRVKPYKGDPYTMIRGGGPGKTAPALPSPAQQRAITPPVVAAALQAAIENDGTWSRRTITAVRLENGRKITRGMWKKLTHALQDILIPQPDRSYRLPPDVSTFDELCERYLPTLKAGQAKTLPVARPSARPPARPTPCPPAHPQNSGTRAQDPGGTPQKRTVVRKSRRELFQELGCDARRVIEARERERQQKEG